MVWGSAKPTPDGGHAVEPQRPPPWIYDPGASMETLVALASENYKEPHLMDSQRARELLKIGAAKIAVYRTIYPADWPMMAAVSYTGEERGDVIVFERPAIHPGKPPIDNPYVPGYLKEADRSPLG